MISFDFEYHRPISIPEATHLYQDLSSQGKAPMYYSGGTEIITMARLNHITTQAVIDLKEIPESLELGMKNNQLILGASLTLTQLAESNPFPFLTEVIRKLADHTTRNKLTLGGNLCGKIIYREAILPFLLCDSQVIIANEKGTESRSIHDLYLTNSGQLQLQLAPGEFIVQVLTNKKYLDLPYQVIRKTALSKIDYPLFTLAAMRKDAGIRLALSGLVGFPFRSRVIEQDVSEPNQAYELRISNALAHLPGLVLNDLRGSADYRLFVLRNTLMDVLAQLEGVG